MSTKTKSRVEKKEEQQNETKGKVGTRKPRRRRYFKRRFPILLRVLVISILLVASLVLGSMVGYGVIGEGDAKDVLHKSTWQHIIDIVKKE